MTKLRIHEIFLDTVQGEGFWTGRLSSFVRLWGCPVKCSWCDTGYADGGKSIPYQEMSIAQIEAKATGENIVITGGEPFIQDGLPELASAFIGRGSSVSIETSGIRYRPMPGSWITLSPKTHATGIKVDDRFWESADEIKIVIESVEDFEFYLPMILPNGWENRHVYVQPCDKPGITLQDAFIPCLETLKRYPWVRSSIQTHKILGVP